MRALRSIYFVVVSLAALPYAAATVAVIIGSLVFIGLIIYHNLVY